MRRSAESWFVSSTPSRQPGVGIEGGVEMFVSRLTITERRCHNPEMMFHRTEVDTPGVEHRKVPERHRHPVQRLATERDPTACAASDTDHSIDSQSMSRCKSASTFDSSGASAATALLRARATARAPATSIASPLVTGNGASAKPDRSAGSPLQALAIKPCAPWWASIAAAGSTSTRRPARGRRSTLPAPRPSPCA